MAKQVKFSYPQYFFLKIDLENQLLTNIGLNLILHVYYRKVQSSTHDENIYFFQVVKGLKKQCGQYWAILNICIKELQFNMNRLVEFHFCHFPFMTFESIKKNPKNCKKLSKSNTGLSTCNQSFYIEIETVGHGK